MSSIRRLAIAIILTLFALSLSPAVAIAEGQKAVLITGASSGLGREMAEMMAAQGHFVYAGARKQADIDALNAIDNIQAVKLDVTDQAQIDAAVKTINEAGRGLYGLINNAGVAVLGPLIEVDEEDFAFQIDVNVTGVYRVTKAFAPMVMESKGRICTVSSIAGVLASEMFGPYSMSKHSMEAFGDSLQAELSRFGVHVCLIEPGTYRSEIGNNMVDRMKRRQQDHTDTMFKEEYAARIKFLTEDLAKSGDPREVAEATMHAMFDPNPKHRYMVVPNQEQADWTIRQQIREMVQFNMGQQYSYSREQLITMLDEVMAEQTGAAAP